MKTNKNSIIKTKYILIIVLGILLISFSSSASTYSRLNPQYTQPMSSANYLAKQGIFLGMDWDESKCEAGQDFLLQINPAGCEPFIVTDSMIEDSNVPVFCPIVATQINPIVKVESIKKIDFSFNGSKPNDVSGVGFHPARAAVKSGDQLINSPILENVGYAVIVIKKQKNNSSIPDFVEGNLKARIVYDIKSAFGIGNSEYYLPEYNQKEWEELWKQSKNEFGILDNKFFLRAESIGVNDAIIGLYTSEEIRYSRVTLTRDQTSDTIYLPGFYCKAGIRLRLDSLENPGTRARLRVGNDVIDVIEGQRFLENKCTLSKITDKEVILRCSDDKTGRTIYLSRTSTDPLPTNPDNDDYYQKAISNYEDIAKTYTYEIGIDELNVRDAANFESIIGKKGLLEAIELSNASGKTDDEKRLNSLYSEKYNENPSKPYNIKDSRSVTINGKSYDISLLEVYESDFDDYGVTITANDVNLDLKKSEIKESGNVKYKLVSLKEGVASIHVEYNGKSITKTIKELESDSFKLDNKEIKIIINHIFLSKIAKVTALPEIKYSETNSNLHFKIGIEKRNIKLSPEKTKEMIENLNKTIKEWEDKTESLGKVVKGLKGACLATGTVLTVKNLFNNLGGGAIANEYVMRGSDGKGGLINDYCLKEENGFKTFAECLSDEKTEQIIETNKEISQKILEEQQSMLTRIREKNTFKTEFMTDVVNNDDYLRDYFNELNQISGLKDSLNNLDYKQTTISELKELHYNYLIMQSQGVEPSLKQSSKNRFDYIISDFKNRESVLVSAEFTQTAIKPEDQKVTYFSNVPNQNVPAIVPFDIRKGWYVGVRFLLSGSTHESGDLKFFYICNVGDDGRINFNTEVGPGADDWCTGINADFGVPQGQVFPKGNREDFTPTETQNLYRNAKDAYSEAFAKYKKGVNYVDVKGQRLKVENAVDIPQVQCQEFMTPSDCKILFNVCDPVVCPSSRCNFGGTYYLDNVIQSGIAGSAFACLNNFVGFGGDVYVPVCLSGVHAGMEGLLSIYKSHRDCLQHKLETGQNIGFCDEIYSIQMCDFFWKQAAPFANLVIPKLLEGIYSGSFVRGGGEYKNVQTAWDNAQQSVDYFTQYYANNAFKIFNAKSITDVGSEACRGFLSTSYPEGAGLLDVLTEPSTPPQFHGWLDSSLHTSATIPPTHQYSVFYHIYAGTEKEEVSYAVYLEGTGELAGVTANIASGKLKKGGYKTEKKDFPAAMGYDRLCIVVDEYKECGFGRASTSFALDYLNDKLVQSEASNKDINSESECVSGSYNVQEFVNPNLQQGAQSFANPSIRKMGITRVCATSNPGGEGSTRWGEVGNCGNPNLKCWLDSESVKDATSLQGVTDRGLEIEYMRLQKELTDMYLTPEEYKNFVIKIKESIDYKVNINNIELLEQGEYKINDKERGVFYGSQKAGLLLLKARNYAKLINEQIQKTKTEEDAKKERGVSSGDDGGTASTTTTTDEKETTTAQPTDTSKSSLCKLKSARWSKTSIARGDSSAKSVFIIIEKDPSCNKQSVIIQIYEDDTPKLFGVMIPSYNTNVGTFFTEKFSEKGIIKKEWTVPTKNDDWFGSYDEYYFDVYVDEKKDANRIATSDNLRVKHN